MHDRLENGDERRAVGEVHVQPDRGILERAAAPGAPPEIHRVQAPDGRVLGVPGL